MAAGRTVYAEQTNLQPVSIMHRHSGAQHQVSPHKMHCSSLLPVSTFITYLCQSKTCMGDMLPRASGQLEMHARLT
jgi:hypothetical protein